jgi:3-methyladenine DNA glycosylase AlkD
MWLKESTYCFKFGKKVFPVTVKEIMTELRSMGSENIKKILLKHGVQEPLFGVKVEQLKTIQKKVKTDYQLARDLYATGNADAMYLAGLIADDKKMTKADLQTWVQKAVSTNISEYTVPWVAAEGNHGFELALLWIDDPKEHIKAAGWATLSNLVALKDDADLDIIKLKSLLIKIISHVHNADNRVRHTMNGFIIAAGSCVAALTDDALATAKKIGTVKVNMDGTACKVPDAAAYILKTKNKGVLGKKKKTVKC